MGSITVNPARPALSLSGTTQVSCPLTFTVPPFPEEVTAWTGVVLSGTWSWGGKGNVSSLSIGGTATSNGIAFSHTLTAQELADGRVTITAKGGNKNATGDNFTWTGLKAVFSYKDPLPKVPPVITVGTPSRAAISDEPGCDECICTFTSDHPLLRWEARATLPGVTPARGVGLLVESGGALAEGASGRVSVLDEELTNGDGTYTVTVYGQSENGYWSDGTFEAVT